MGISWTMIRNRIKIFSALFLLVSSPIFAATLTPYTMALKASKYGSFTLTLRGEQQLQQRPDGAWNLTLSTKNPFISVLEQSTFWWKDGHTVPSRYVSNNRIALSQTKQDIVFDAKKQQIRVSTKDGNRTFPHDSDVQDVGSFQINLMQRLENQFLNLTAQERDQKAAAMVGEHFSYVVQEWTEQSTFVFTVTRHAIIESAVGMLSALLLIQRDPKHPSVSKYYWVAMDYGFIPIKVEQYSGSKLTSRIELQSGSFGGRPIVGF